MLITDSEVRDFLKLGDDTYDDIYPLIASGVYAYIENITGGLDATDYDEVYIFTKPVDFYVFPKHIPIISVSEIYINDNEVDLTSVSGVVYDDCIFVPYTSIYKVRVKYRAGYETLPHDLKLAILYIIKQQFNIWKNNDESTVSESNAFYTSTKDLKLPFFVREILKKYRIIF